MSRPGDVIQKDPDSDEPQGFDWTRYCLGLGSTVGIASSVWDISGPDAAMTMHDPVVATQVEINGEVRDGHFTRVFVVGGTAGERYRLRNRIITNSVPPVTDDRSVILYARHR